MNDKSDERSGSASSQSTAILEGTAGTRNHDKRSLGLLQWLLDYRDRLLVATSAVYVLGYLVWSAHAWQSGLGLLPAINAQYFVAGIVPALIIYLVFYGIRGVIKHLEKFSNWLYADAQSTRWKKLIQASFKWLKTAALVLFAVSRTRWFGRTFSGKEDIVSWACLAVVGLIGLVDSEGRATQPKELERPRTSRSDRPQISFSDISDRLQSLWDRFQTFYLRFLVRYLFIFLGLVGGGLFIRDVYPNIPQELGGVQPRCVYLDVAKDELSVETLKGIVPEGAVYGDRAVVRSLKVELLFSGGSTLIVRSQERPYEIAKGVIQAVVSCD